MRMRKSVRARWVAALRSGEYQQGYSALHAVTPEDEHRFCCLGVLCELAVQDGVEIRVDTPSIAESDGNRYVHYEAVHSYPPGAVDTWARYGNTEGPVNWSFLATLNDEGLSFERIAEMIETDPDADRDYDDTAEDEEG